MDRPIVLPGEGRGPGTVSSAPVPTRFALGSQGRKVVHVEMWGERVRKGQSRHVEGTHCVSGIGRLFLF